MKYLSLLVLLIATSATAASPSSINNDDSCDVRVGPAATLLLPYFEVDILGNSGQTTLFTIVNVTRYPQIAHVTLWTDWAYPVLTFNLYLTGYDVQAINLADILGRGIIAPPSGTSSTTKPGSRSASTNPNLRSPLDCTSIPAALTQTILAAIRAAFTTGVYPGVECSVGNSHAGSERANAIGYATIDVVASCTSRDPTDPLYHTNDLLFDNVLIGDYQQIGARPSGVTQGGFDAGGNPMVHIRAVPEGGGAGSNVATALPYTFYDRYTGAIRRTFDRRQPLPSTFAARFIQGGPAAFATNFTIWREGVTGSGASCASYRNNGQIQTGLDEFIRFDEHDNPSTVTFPPICEGCFSSPPVLPATSSQNTASGTFPSLATADVGGWLYLNLNNGGSSSYSVTSHPSETTTTGPSSTPFGNPRASQNWVTVTMFGNVGASRMTAEFDAAPLGNGCSPAAATIDSGAPIGPAGGLFLCPPGTTLTDGTTTLCKGTNVNPTP